MTIVQTSQDFINQIQCCAIRIVCAITLTLFTLPVIATEARVAIDPSDPNISYTGRWNFDNSSEPWFGWQGASIVANFSGTAISIDLDAGTGTEYFRVIINGDIQNSNKFAAGSGRNTYELASGLANGLHRVEVVKETFNGDKSTFYGLEVTGSGLVAPPTRPSRKIEFYGDSNLAGYSLEHERNNGAYQYVGTFFGYAGIVSRMLDAEYHNISISGATISAIHEKYNRFDWHNTTPEWDFSNFVPDLVVVNLGANDVGRQEADIRDDYHSFLDDLRATHPNAHIMLYNAWGWDYDEPANYTHEVISERNDPNMSVATFPWVFEQWHGCEYDHGGMAAYLARHIRRTLGWQPADADVMSGFGFGGNVANGGFEEVAPFGGYGWRYTADSGVNRIEDSQSARSGSYYLQLSNGASSHQPNPARDGDRIRVIAWLRSDTDGASGQVTIDFRDQQMYTTPIASTNRNVSLTTNWQRYSFVAQAPSGSTPVFHTRVTFTAGPSGTLEIDDVRMITIGANEAFPDEHEGQSSLLQTPDNATFALHSAYPNPFNPTTLIRFEVPSVTDITVNIYDVSGRLVRVLASGPVDAGLHEVSWNGLNEAGVAVASGVYIYQLRTSEGFSETRQMLLVR